jgi:diacylglycerol kinase family enzyme
VRGLYGSPTALGVLPGGTSNVFAQELGLRGLTWTRVRALEHSAGLMARGTIRDVDLGLAGNLPFLLWSGIGLDAYLTHKIEPRARWEKDFSVATYAASSVWNAQFYRGLNLKVIADGQVVEGHYLVAIMGNISLYAGGLARLSPYALLDDGIFELWLLEGNTVGDAIQRFLDVVAGRHMESRYAYCLPFHNLELESDKPLYVQLDAEPIDYDNCAIQITVKPKALRLMIPERYPRRLFLDDPEENDERWRE